MAKKILCILGIVIGIAVIIIGFSVMDTYVGYFNTTIGSPGGNKYTFGADFYTEIYDVTWDVGNAINSVSSTVRSAAYGICTAIGWLLVAGGAAIGLTFGWRLVHCFEEEAIANTADNTYKTGSSSASAPVFSDGPAISSVARATVKEGYWTCVCGKVNANYVGTCGCGCTKEASKAQSEQQDEEARRAAAENAGPTANGWRCFCGAENPNYVGTCMCGVSKRDVLNR